VAKINQPDNLDIEIEIDLDLLVKKLLANPKFIEKVTNKIRKEMTRDVRSVGNLFGPWAGK
jgi:hypothetical protein